jgi:predicted transcriptional regulator
VLLSTSDLQGTVAANPRNTYKVKSLVDTRVSIQSQQTMQEPYIYFANYEHFKVILSTSNIQGTEVANPRNTCTITSLVDITY